MSVARGGAHSDKSGVHGDKASFLNRAGADVWLAADAKPLHAYLVAGSDDVAISELRHGLVKRFSGADPLGLSRSEYDAASCEPADLLDALRELPFFASCRVVIVQRAEKLSEERFGGILDLVKGLDESTLLVLESSTRAAELAALPVAAHCLNRRAAAYCYAPGDDSEAIRWVMEHARRHRVTLERDAAEEMIRLVGLEPLELAGELRKLALALDRQVTLAGVKELLAPHREREVFDWVDAVMSGSRRAVRLVQTATDGGRDGIAAIGALAQRLELVAAMQKGQRIPMHPRMARAVSDAAARWSTIPLDRARKLLLELDMLLKVSPTELHLARLELATLKLVELVLPT